MAILAGVSEVRGESPSERARSLGVKAHGLAVEAQKLQQAEKQQEARAKYVEVHKTFDAAAEACRQAVRTAKPKDKPALQHEWAKMVLAQSRIARGLSGKRRVGLIQQAITSLKAALKLDPTHVDSQRLLCELYWGFVTRRLIRPDDYIAEADKLLKMDAKAHEVWFQRGFVRASQVSLDGDLADKALKDMAQAISLKADEVSYRVGRAGFEERIRRLDAADATYKAALKVAANANDPELRGAYAWFLLRRGFREDAQAQIKEAVKRSKKGQTLALQMLARFHREDGRPEKALEVLERARTMDPNDYRIYRELGAVHGRQKNVVEAAAVLRRAVAAIERSVPEPGTSQEAVRKQMNHFNARAQLNHELGKMILAAAVAEKDKAAREKQFVEVRACAREIREIGGPEAFSDGLDGQVAYYEGKYREALRLLEKAYVAFGRSLEPVSASVLMELYNRAGQPGKAEAIVNRMLRDPQQRKQASLWLVKARIVMGYGQWAEAERYVREALRLEAGNQEAGQLLLVSELGAGRTDILPPGLKPTPTVVAGAMMRSRALWADSQFKTAIELIEDLFSRVPDNMQVAQQLINMYQLSKQEIKLEDLLEKLKAAQPKLAKQIEFHQALLAEKDPKKKLAMQIERAGQTEDPLSRELALADLYRSVGQTAKFIEHLDRADKLKPGSPGIILRRLNHAIATKDWDLGDKVVAEGAKGNIDGTGGRLLAARLAIARGMDGVAVRLYTDVLRANKNNKQVRISRGQLLMRHGRLVEAAEDFRTVVDSDPGNTTAVIGMMLVTERLGKQEDFDKWLDRAHRLAPRHPEVAKRVTNRAERLSGNLAQIIARRRKQLASNPRDLDNRLRLGMLYERAGDLPEAEKMFVGVWKLAANKLPVTRQLAWFYGRTGRLGQADALIQGLLKAAKTPEQKMLVYILYGDFLTPFKPDQARRAYGEAIQADPKNPEGHYALAQFHARQSRWAEAIQAMTRCVELRKDAPGLEKTLISYQISDGKFSDAETRLEEILQASPLDIGALRLKARLILRRDMDIGKAEKVLNTAVGASGNDVGSLLDRARLYLSTGSLAKAKSDLEKITQLTGDVKVALDLGSLYARLKEYSKAEELFKRVLKRQPGLQEAIRRLGAVYSAQKKWTDLEALLAEAGKADPKNPAYAMMASGMWTGREKPDKALASLAEAMKIAPASPTVVGAYLNALLRAEQYPKVLEVTKGYLGKKNFVPMAAAVHARALAKSGKVAEASVIFRGLVKDSDVRSLGFISGQMAEGLGVDKAIARLPEWRVKTTEWQLYHVVAGLHRKAKQQPEVVKALLMAIRLAAANPKTQAGLSVELGMTYSVMGRHGESEKAYLAALAVLPDHVALLNNLAYLYVSNLDQPKKALPHITKAYALAPANGNILDTYGWVLSKLDRDEEAEKYLTLAAEQPDVSALIRHHLGQVYEKRGKLPEALKQYKLGLELIPDKPVDKDKELQEKITTAIQRVEGKRKQ